MSEERASQLDPETFRRVVRLARIELTAEEEAELAPQLDEIVGWIDDLRRWRADDEGPEAPDRAETSRRRGALRAPGLDRHEALDRAPDRVPDPAHDGEHFLVPPMQAHGDGDGREPDDE